MVGVGAADGVGAGCAGVDGCSVEVVGEGLCSDGVDCEFVGSVDWAGLAFCSVLLGRVFSWVDEESVELELSVPEY